MRSTNKKIILSLLSAIIITTSFIPNIYAKPQEITTPKPAKSAIVMDQKTGRVLLSADSDLKVFPASTTKILTAIVALDFLKLEDIVIVGEEIKEVPFDSSKAEHVVGEAISVENLIRGLMIPSGNESACVLAMEVARVQNPSNNISYLNAESNFANLMNEKAKSLGALNSNFVNPHGYHNENHYTTAFDMALIARESMKNELIAKVVKEIEFTGNSAGDKELDYPITVNHSWKTHNELLLGGEFFYKYAAGIKTGFTDEAGNCLVSYAKKDDEELISAVFFSEDPARWENSIYLLDYAFDNFQVQKVQQSGIILDSLEISNPQLGAEAKVGLMTNENFEYFMSNDEYKTISKEIIYDQNFLEKNLKDNQVGKNLLITDLKKDTTVATIKYSLDDQELFTSNLVLANDIEKRNLSSDIKYYFNIFKSNVLTLNALPYWGIAIVVLIIIFFIRKRLKRNKRYKNRLRRRYY